MTQTVRCVVFPATGDPIELSPAQVEQLRAREGFRVLADGYSWVTRLGVPVGHGEIVKALKKQKL